MTPLTYYHQKIASGEILPDAQQLAVMTQFEAIYQHLLLKKPRWRKTPIHGLYLWGNVGIGKTFLVDTFFYALPFDDKLRLHFYAFMQQVHADLKSLQGQKNPLKQIAKNLAARARVICLDELLVTDIGDAMVLGGLIQALLLAGICLVFTANVPPDDLYKNGLQRERFLPAIASMNWHLDVVHLQIVDDYRQRQQAHKKFYFYPCTVEAQKSMEECFRYFSQGVQPSVASLQILGREIKVIKQAEGVVWFDFLAICGKPRGQDDYLELVRQFHTILVSNLTAIAAENLDLARTFIKFVDVLYDAKIRLIIAAAQPIELIYPEGRLAFEFARTRSRLVEMQGRDDKIEDG
jgi:cell division protein ZapE